MSRQESFPGELPVDISGITVPEIHRAPGPGRLTRHTGSKAYFNSTIDFVWLKPSILKV